jgi:membrane protein
MAKSAFSGIKWNGIYGRPWKTFFKDLYREINEDHLTNGAAALGFYFMLAIFPAMIFLLSLIPYLPIDNLQQAIMDLLRQALPAKAADMFSGTVAELTTDKKGGLISTGALLSIWAASTGMYAVMQHLNITYDVRDTRSFFKARGIAILLTLGFGLLLIVSFALIVLGGKLQDWLVTHSGIDEPLLTSFAILRWVIVAVAMTFAFALTYYYGPDVEQEFRFVSPGSALGVMLMVVASFGFKLYVENFGSYDATYGSIGAVVVLMLWLNITGLVILLGSEVNALIEHYSPQGKEKGEKVPDGRPSSTARPARPNVSPA